MSPKTAAQTVLEKPTPPGPAGKLLVGNAKEFQRDQLGFLIGLARDHGDVVSFRLGPSRCLALFHPDHVKHVLVDNQANYQKLTRLKNASPAVLGNGLVTSDGAFWRRQRRIAQPVFLKQRIAALAGPIVAFTAAMVEGLRAPARAGTPVEMAHAIGRVTERIAGKTLLGIDLEGAEYAELGQAIKFGVQYAIKRIGAAVPMPEYLPTPANRKYRTVVKLLDKIVYGAIEARRKSPDGHDDLLAMLMGAKDEETGEGMDDKQLRDEVLTMYLAGQETTANTLLWTLYLLAAFPSVQRAVRAEIAAALGDGDPGPGMHEKLPLTMRVILESMRLYPPAQLTGREPIERDEIGGYEVPAGSTVFLSQYVSHRDPRFWDHPEGFDPDHFLPEKVKARPKYAYFPFGGGPRQCIGQGLAMMEMAIVLPMLLRAYQVDLPRGAKVEPAAYFTLQPRDGLPLVLRAI